MTTVVARARQLASAADRFTEGLPGRKHKPCEEKELGTCTRIATHAKVGKTGSNPPTPTTPVSPRPNLRTVRLFPATDGQCRMKQADGVAKSPSRASP